MTERLYKAEENIKHRKERKIGKKLSNLREKSYGMMKKKGKGGSGVSYIGNGMVIWLSFLLFIYSIPLTFNPTLGGPLAVMDGERQMVPHKDNV